MDIKKPYEYSRFRTKKENSLVSPSKRYFTKSLFNLADECPTKLYYTNKTEYANERESDEFLIALAEGGFQVGALAKCYYPEGIEIGSIEPEEAIEQTNDLLQRENVTIFEAAVDFNDFFVRIDILKKKCDHLDLIEVKSKSYHPEEDKFLTRSGNISSAWNPYLYDAAFQTCVLREALPDLRVSPHLMLVDKSKTTSVEGLNERFRLENKTDHVSVEIGGDVTLKGLGTQILGLVDVSEYVEMILTGDYPGSEETSISFLDQISEYAQNYKNDERFPVSIGQKCKTCEFNTNPASLTSGRKSGFRECWKDQLGWSDENFDKPLVFDIWNFRHSQECINDGIYLMEDIPCEDYFMKKNKKGELEFKSPTTERQHLQINELCSEKGGREVVDSTLFMEIEKWHFPLHFVDFETSMVAIPFNKGRRPYEQIAFQFSCHTLHGDGQIEHAEWIQKQPGQFPNFDFLIALKEILERDEGTILRYTHYENSVLRKIHNQLQKAVNGEYEMVPPDPDNLLTWIDSITEWDEKVIVKGKSRKVRQWGSRNMADMFELVKRFYYHPMMGGSNSMKVVLPAVVSASKFLKEKYSNPYSGTNYKSMIWWHPEEGTGRPVDPYSLLPPIFEDVDISKDELFLDNEHIQEGGAAMLAYAKMQFCEMGNEEREAIIKGLLKYCELDTLAMLMVYEHWNFLKCS